jgi:hypothetical protein
MMDPHERKALADIAAYGCHVIHVAAEDDLPGFSYSVGIFHSSSRPEVIVVGLRPPLAHFVVNEFNARVRAGEAFVESTFYEGFLEGFSVVFVPVARSHYREHFGWNRWLYKGDAFPALQLVFPSTGGLWPWDPGAPEAYLEAQPILTDSGRLDAPPAGLGKS